MAYMRGHFYIWSDGDGVNFHHGHHNAGDEEALFGCSLKTESRHVWLPREVVEDFAAMFWCRLPEDRQREVLARVSERYGGENFGADGVQRLLGRPTVMDGILGGLAKREA